MSEPVNARKIRAVESGFSGGLGRSGWGDEVGVLMASLIADGVYPAIERGAVVEPGLTSWHHLESAKHAAITRAVMASGGEGRGDGGAVPCGCSRSIRGDRD